MPKVNNIASTAHSQHKELTQLVGGTSAELQAQVAALTEQLHGETVSHAATADTNLQLNAQIDSLTAELAAEKEAHAATQAALTAATATTSTPAA